VRIQVHLTLCVIQMPFSPLHCVFVTGDDGLGITWHNDSYTAQFDMNSGEMAKCTTRRAERGFWVIVVKMTCRSECYIL